MNIKAKLQDAVNALNYGSISVQNKKEEETCSYRIKQTKTRKTIAINCRECDSGSSLNDMHCRKTFSGYCKRRLRPHPYNKEAQNAFAISCFSQGFLKSCYESLTPIFLSIQSRS